MKKILFIASHRKNRAPGQRFRFEQYFDYLSENGFQCELSYIVSITDDKVFYKKGNYFKKFLISLRSALKRRNDLRRANDYDIIFIFREALMTRSTFFERGFKKSRAKLVFDFDDAIWLSNVSEVNKRFGWIKDSDKTSKLIALSDMVFAGNKYLAGYAAPYNTNIKIIPTTIDTVEYNRVNTNRNDNRVCIGWSGSITTIQHFEYAIPFLTKIKEKYGDKIFIKVIGDVSYFNKDLEIKGLAWNKNDEIKELSDIDIGIMPLPDDEWAKGKCGLKGLQYMALEIPTIMSPVGVNTEIINDGKNGFLACGTEEWVEKVSLLIESEELRKKMGVEARKTVLEKFSVSANRDNYIKYFNELLE